MRRIAILVLGLLAFAPALAAEPPEPGHVQLPLDAYTRLWQQASDPTRPPRPAPAGYALGTAGVTVDVQDADGRASATIQVQLAIDVLEAEWVLVPVLPAGTPVDSVSVDGRPVQLIATPEGLAWGTNQLGSYTLRLGYKVDAVRSEGGFALPVPLPQAAAIQLQATLPGSGLDVAVIPAAGTRLAAAGATTRVTATVPTTRGIQISWRVPARRGHTISRAAYAGALQGEAIVWTAKLAVELFNDDTATLPLLPRDVTLGDVQVDGKRAAILVEGDRFVTLVRGQGAHEVTVVFQTRVLRADGPPRVELPIPQVPVSRFELALPGKKELTVVPASSITSTPGKGTTVAVVHVPMTDRVAFSWSEAVPEDVKAELRANAATYHLVHAEEGVLYVRALVAYEVTRGESNVIELSLPPGVQINRIESPSGAVADWRPVQRAGNVRAVSVFLDRQLRGELLLDVHYDRPLGDDDARSRIDIPLIRPAAAQRQKGMVALLASSELTLGPLEAAGATRVGENQLPAFVREAVTLTVAHTYKYAETLPRLVVAVAEPERVDGKFDVQVDTLISLGDVTLGGSATIQVQVKSGRLMELRVALPAGVSLLGLTAPSLRTYKVHEEGGERFVDVEFTQEMEGQFRLDLTYERILAEAGTAVEAPVLAVPVAEVEQGRIAVEALTAVEVQPEASEQLSSLDVNELPQQLVLRTTNPILLAYKYVRAETPHRLALRVTRHEMLGVQEATIDQAVYKTLFTTDGLLVTTAEFSLRNSRKQFLRLRLPEGSEVWSAFVGGKAEKPASAGEAGDAARDVLIKIINSTDPFDVQLIYATAGPRIGRLGTLEGTLPVPDILVTQSRWDLFLPEGLRYGRPSTNLQLAGSRDRVSRDALAAELGPLEDAARARQALRPLRLTVPTSGVRFTFEKLYANQRGQRSWVELPYASASGAALGQAASLAGTLLFWSGGVLFALAAARTRRLAAAGASLAGLALAGTALAVYRVGVTPALVLSLFAFAGIVVAGARRGRLGSRLAHMAGES